MHERKVVFLDLDGVVNCCECDRKNFEKLGLNGDDIYLHAA